MNQSGVQIQQKFQMVYLWQKSTRVKSSLIQMFFSPMDSNLYSTQYTNTLKTMDQMKFTKPMKYTCILAHLSKQGLKRIQRRGGSGMHIFNGLVGCQEAMHSFGYKIQLLAQIIYLFRTCKCCFMNKIFQSKINPKSSNFLVHLSLFGSVS